MASDGDVEMGHDGLISRESVDWSRNAARLVREAGKEKAAARLGEWKTRMLNVAAPVSAMVRFVVSLQVLLPLVCVAAQLPPGEDGE